MTIQEYNKILMKMFINVLLFGAVASSMMMMMMHCVGAFQGVATPSSLPVLLTARSSTRRYYYSVDKCNHHLCHRQTSRRHRQQQHTTKNNHNSLAAMIKSSYISKEEDVSLLWHPNKSFYHYFSNHYHHSRVTSCLAAALSNNDNINNNNNNNNNENEEDVMLRVVLPPRRVKIRARTTTSTTTTTATTTTTPGKTRGNSENNMKSSSIRPNRKKNRNDRASSSSSLPYNYYQQQQQEMLDHTILSREEELVLGRQVICARILREGIDELLLEKKKRKRRIQEQHPQKELQYYEGKKLLRQNQPDNEEENDDDDDDDNDEEEEEEVSDWNSETHPRYLDYDFLSYELEYLSMYGFRRSKDMRKVVVDDSGETDTTYYDGEIIEKNYNRLLGGYDLDDDLLFEHVMHRAQHYSQLVVRRDDDGMGKASSSSSSSSQQQYFGPKRTGYRNESTSSSSSSTINRNSYSSFLHHVPLHLLDESDVKTLLLSAGVAKNTTEGVGGGGEAVQQQQQQQQHDLRFTLVDILLDGAHARETLMRRNIKLVMSIAKNWMRNSFTTANSNENNHNNAGGGGGSSKRNMNDKSSKQFYAKMYEGSWDKPSLDEAVQEGMLGLARAVDKFDPERGLRFSTYATYWITSYVRVCFQRALTGCLRVPSQLHDIRAAYNQIVKDHNHMHYYLGSTTTTTPSYPDEKDIAQQLNISEQRLRIAIRATGTLLSVDAPIVNGGNGGKYKGSMAGGDGRNGQELLLLDTLKCAEPRPEDQVEISFLRQCLENAMATELTPYERDVLRLRLGLDSGEGKTVREIVELSGNIVSMADVRSAERRAFKKLRSPSSVHTHNLLAYLDTSSIGDETML